MNDNQTDRQSNDRYYDRKKEYRTKRKREKEVETARKVVRKTP